MALVGLLPTDWLTASCAAIGQCLSMCAWRWVLVHWILFHNEGMGWDGMGWDGMGQAKGYVVDGRHGCWHEMTESLLLLLASGTLTMWVWVLERERSEIGK